MVKQVVKEESLCNSIRGAAGKTLLLFLYIFLFFLKKHFRNLSRILKVGISTQHKRVIFKKKNNATTWQEILEGCLRREARAQRQLFERYANFAKNVCLRYAQNEAEAEEIASDGFLKVFDKIEKYDCTQPFEGWLKRIMINTAIDYYRRNLHKINWSDLDVASQVPYSDSFYKDDYLMNITADEIMVFVQRLPVSYRTVFSLSVVEGYNHNEIAEMLGISESASRSNLSKAKAKLQSWISAYVVQQNEITHKHE